MIPPPSTRVPIVAARNPRLRSSAGSSIGSTERDSTTAKRTSSTSAATNTTTTPAVSPDRAWVSPLTSSVIAAPSVTTPGEVEPARVLGRRLRQPQAGDDQGEGEHPDHDVGLAPAGADVERRGQHDAGRDPEPDAGAPDRGAVAPLLRRARTVGEDRQPAREDRGAADPLEHPRADEERAARRHRHTAASRRRSRPAPRRTSAAGPARHRPHPRRAGPRRAPRSSS